MLRILLRNLLDNAIRYTPVGGRVEVTLRLTETQQIELEIADSGSGVHYEKSRCSVSASTASIRLQQKAWVWDYLLPNASRKFITLEFHSATQQHWVG